jgi:RNA polymerase sigma-70 factor (ECF subfamily)
VADTVEPTRVRVRPQTVDAGRAEAFVALVERELERSYRLATVILGNESDGQDAVHDAAEIAWRRYGELRDPDKATAWFRQILVNRCRDRLRWRRRWRVFQTFRPTNTPEATVDDASAVVAERDALARTFERLSPDERVIVVLRYEEDMTVPAIAELLAIPEGTAKSRLHYALAKLRTALAEER